MLSCNPNPFALSQRGRLIYPGTESEKQGPERPQRLSRANRSTMRIEFGAAVTDAPGDGCQPPVLDTDRILGFTLQITSADVNPGEQWLPDIYEPGDIVNVTLNDRILAIAPCDVMPGDPVFVEPGTGLPAETGLLAPGCTWETKTMAGGIAVIQVNTRPQWNVVRGGDMTYPPGGIAVSLGNAWGVSIDPARVPYLDTANLFGPTQTFNNGLNVIGEQVNEGDLVIEGSFAATGEAAIEGDLAVGGKLACTSIAADSADLSACTVGNSPVRTMANTPDYTQPPPQVYPPVGIAVSDGSRWVAPVDPARLAYLDRMNAFMQSQSINGNLSAAAATFNTCAVAGSPVRTMANTPDAVPPVPQAYPPAGVAVSDGSAWAASINPATLAHTDVANTFTAAQTFNGAVTLALDPTQPLQAATKQYVDANSGGGGGGMVYPGAGLALSTGTAWGTSVDPATLARTNAANIFTAAQTAPNFLSGTSDTTHQIHVASNDQFQMMVETTNPIAYAVFRFKAPGQVYQFALGGSSSAPQTAGHWYLYDETNGGMLLSVAPNSGDLYVAGALSVGGGKASLLDEKALPFTTYIDAAGNATFNGSVSAQHFLSGTNDTTYQLNLQQGGEHFIYMSTVGQGSWAVMRMGSPTQTWQLYVSGTGNTDDGHFYIKDQNNPSAAIEFVPGTGDMICSGTITGKLKNFSIPYPGDAGRTLTHSSLEGPEIAVFYRGEVETADGAAEVTLPEYFEALTTWEGRSIVLTQVYDDAAAEFTMLMASRIVGGKFTIRSSTPSAKVAWEVKAIRADVPPLAVITITPPTVRGPDNSHPSQTKVIEAQ